MNPAISAILDKDYQIFILSLYILVKMSCKTRDIGLLLYISANLSHHSASCLSNTFIYTIIYKVKSAKDFAKMQERRNQISFQVLLVVSAFLEALLFVLRSFFFLLSLRTPLFLCYFIMNMI